MLNRQILALVAATSMGAALALGVGLVAGAPDTALPWSVFGSGGSTNSSSASYGLGAMAGQPAIGQADSAGFRLGAGFWYGACADPDTDGVTSCPPPDNCPGTANPGQQNAVHPGTPAGDHCEDPEPDGVFDIADNCPDTANAGQENADGDQWGDACDNCPGFSTAWAVPLGDGDCDYFTTVNETFMGTDAGDRCADTLAPDDERGPAFGEPVSPWPTDNNDNRLTSLGDVLRYIPVFNTFAPGPPYDKRYDLNASGSITLADVLQFIPVFNLTCTP